MKKYYNMVGVVVLTILIPSSNIAWSETKQPKNIFQCFTCFLKKPSDWTWEQEIRRGVREDPKYITCRRYKQVRTKSGQHVCLYKGANNTYSLVVEGSCPATYRCKYNPNGSEPNIGNVVDSLNDSFKKK